MVLWLASKKWRRSLRKKYEMSNNNDYATGNLLDFNYFKKNYRLIATDLSMQTKLKNPQQIILLENLKTKIMEQQCSLSLKNQKKKPLMFHKILSQSYK